MNAQEAKQLAQTHVAQVEEAHKLKAANHRNVEVNLLHTHFLNKIEEAVKKGALSTEAANMKIEFPEERFSNEVISDVVDKLRGDGYVVSKETHNTYKTVNFKISWA